MSFYTSMYALSKNTAFMQTFVRFSTQNLIKQDNLSSEYQNL